MGSVWVRAECQGRQMAGCRGSPGQGPRTGDLGGMLKEVRVTHRAEVQGGSGQARQERPRRGTYAERVLVAVRAGGPAPWIWVVMEG